MGNEGNPQENKPGNWYAIRVEPGREARVEWVMENRFELERYIPRTEGMVTVDLQQWQNDIRDQQKEQGISPRRLVDDTQSFRGSLVPGFVFIRAEMTDELAHDIGESPYVVRLLPTNRAPRPIADSAIDAMRRMCEALIRQTGDTPDLDWMLGKTFKVKDGTWADRAGTCIAFDRSDQPVLLIEAFKARYLPIAMQVDHLDLVPIDDDFTQDVDIFRKKRITKATNRRNRCRTRVAS